MRATRAALAGIGATGSLVVAIMCVFAVSSAMVAFNGFPHTGLGAKIRSLVLDDQPAARNGPGPAPAPNPSRSPARRSAAVRTLSRSRRLRAAAPSATSPVVAPQPSGARPATNPGGGSRAPSSSAPSPVPPAHAAGQPAAPPPPRATLADTVQTASGTIASSVTRTTDQLGGELGTVAGPPVALGQPVGGTVAGTGQLLGGVLRGGRSGSR